MTTVERRHGCGARVLEGITLSGFDVLLDLEVLDPLGELEVILDGRHTFTLYVQADEIGHRTPSRIRAHPAGTRPRTEVHPAHRCQETRR